MSRSAETLRPLDARIYPVLVRQIYARSNIGIIATIVNAVIFVGVLWGANSAPAIDRLALGPSAGVLHSIPVEPPIPQDPR
jgi:hypothetical protein